MDITYCSFEDCPQRKKCRRNIKVSIEKLGGIKTNHKWSMEQKEIDYKKLSKGECRFFLPS